MANAVLATGWTVVEALRWMRVVGCAVAVVGMMCLATPALADLGGCAQPVSTGPAPVASDCLYILNVAVGAASCEQECACAPKGTLPVSATDALVCLAIAVGGSGSLSCPCEASTTTSTTSTTITTTTSSTTTVSVTTTTLADPCDPNPCQNGGECTPIGGDFFCNCFPDWTGPTCEQCGTPCSENPDYFRGRFLSCVVDTEFCDRPYATCPEFCAEWMGCAGELYIDETYGTITGIVQCF